MNDLIQYLLEASLVVAVLYSFYYLALRNDTFFKFNRTYLLGVMALTVALPLVNVTLGNDNETASGISQSINAIQLPAITVGKGTSDAFSWWQLGALIYTVIVLALVTRLIIRLISIARLARRYPSHKQNGIVWIDSEEPATFSFFNWLFLAPKHRGDKVVANSIISHEKAHIRQGHSWDVIAAELFTAAIWINPFAWLLNHAIRQNHEYLADEAALHDRTERENYARLIVHDASRQRQVVFGNHFSQFQIKRRLTMLYKNRNSQLLTTLKMLPIPVLVLALFVACNSQKEQITKPVPSSQENAINISGGSSSVELFENKEKGQRQMLIKHSTEKEIDQMAEYPGGMEAFMTYVQNHLEYDEAVLGDTSNERMVMVQFTIGTEGEIAGLEMLNNDDPRILEIVREAFTGMPKWQPAMKDGQPVETQMYLPIKFKKE